MVYKVNQTPLERAEQAFTKWLGEEYDLDALRVTLAAAAVERLGGDPLWLLLVSGSGNAKTETVGALAKIATVTSTITSEGALLSATSQKEKAKDSTGGLLRKIGDRGILVIKDVTSILSMNRDLRASVLAALREVYDGHWSRNVGTDGGRTLDWSGRIATIGAVTTAWDTAHAVISSMGDRFVLCRLDSTKGRILAGRRAIGNTDHEIEMRAELAEAVARVVEGVDTEATYTVTDEDTETLLAAADLVTLARTGVEFDYRGNVEMAHAPEMPTRFAKQLAQIVRGGLAIGMARADAVAMAIRCARDSVPPMRLAIIDDLSDHPESTATDCRKRLQQPRATVDRQMQALHMLGVLELDEQPWGMDGTRWYYSLATGINPNALKVYQKCHPTHSGTQEESSHTPGDKSGKPSGAAALDRESGATECLSRSAGKEPEESVTTVTAVTDDLPNDVAADETEPPVTHVTDVTAESPNGGVDLDPGWLLFPNASTCVGCGNDLLTEPGRTSRCRTWHQVGAS